MGEKSKKLSFLNEKHVRKCQILTNVHQMKRKKMERTKKRSQRDGGSLPELLVITHCLHTSLDNKKTHLDKTKNYLYGFRIHFDFDQNKNSRLYGFHIHFIFQKGKPIFVNP